MKFRLRRWRHRSKLAARWWLWPHREHRPFFVLATYRSGSNLLIDYLRHIPDVECYGEVLLINAPIGLSAHEYSPTRARHHLRYTLQSLAAPVRGCKLMLDQLEHCQLNVKDLRASFQDAVFLILYRESLLDQYVSLRLAETTGQWRTSHRASEDQLQIMVDPTHLVNFCRETRQRYEAIMRHSWLRDRSVLFSYEQLVADPRRLFVEQICPLLSLPPHEPKTQLQKQNTVPLARRIENFDDLATLVASDELRQRHTWPATALQRAA